MKNPYKILFLEDNENDVMLIEKTLKKSISFEAEHATNKQEFISKLSSFAPDIILSDHSLPQFDSLSALEIVKQTSPKTPFILVTGSVSEEFAVTCIKNGAENYILKDNLIRLPSAVEHAMSKKELKTENAVIKGLNQKLEKLYALIRQKNKDVTDSMNYSQHIQQAMLPNIEKVTQVFPNSFILNKPKDIISGDFYWFCEHNHTRIMAVGDCTGHGIPGALLSIASCVFLKNSIYDREKDNAADILNDLNDVFCNTFNVSAENAMMDGMDIAVCTLFKNRMKLNFSSARRPIYILRDNNIYEFKSSSQPIGYSYRKREPYSNTEIPVKKKDRIYMFSDGFTDQFGGANGKKFKSSGFRSLILKMQEVPMTEQANYLNNELQKWRTKEEQTDDILIMGFEI